MLNSHLRGSTSSLTRHWRPTRYILCAQAVACRADEVSRFQPCGVVSTSVGVLVFDLRRGEPKFALLAGLSKFIAVHQLLRLRMIRVVFDNDRVAFSTSVSMNPDRTFMFPKNRIINVRPVLDQNNQAEIVSLDIKNGTAAFQDARIRVGFLDIFWRLNGTFRNFQPRIELDSAAMISYGPNDERNTH